MADQTNLTDVQKVLLGGGALRNISRRVDGTNPVGWKPPQTVHVPWNRENVQENRRLYPHLFTD